MSTPFAIGDIAQITEAEPWHADLYTGDLVVIDSEVAFEEAETTLGGPLPYHTVYEVGYAGDKWSVPVSAMKFLRKGGAQA